MRVDLPNGQWAELRERLDYGPARNVRRAYLATLADNVAGADVDLELVKAYVVTWLVRDSNDEEVSLEEPWKADDEPLQLIAVAAAKLWHKKNDPKGKPSDERTSPTSLKALG